MSKAIYFDDAVLHLLTL